MKRPAILFLFILLFAKCANQQQTQNNPITDSLYKYADLKNTKNFAQDNGSYKILDSLQKRQLLPDITKGTSMGKNFPYSSLFSAYFVSKQKKIGSIQPIILKLFADDFTQFILINLNENNTPVDFMFIDNEEFCGSDHNFYCEKSRHSIFNESEIFTYDLFKIESTNNDLTSYIDSITYKSFIQPSGSIKTSKIASARIVRSGPPNLAGPTF